MSSPASVLVAGGAGFIGCNFVRHLLAKTSARVTVVDKLTYAGNLESLADVVGDPRFELVRADIAVAADLSPIVGRVAPTWIVNFAAESHVDRSIDGPRAFVTTNVVGAFELLEAARAHVASLDDAARAGFRFLHVSTDEVFGSLGPTGAFTESTPYAPSSPYSATKAAADHIANAYALTYGLHVVVTNCSNNYGPYQYPEKLVPLMVLNALAGRDLPIYGTGSNVRDWLHVDDHCEGILLALAGGRRGERYNLGGFGERTNVQVVDAVCAALETLVPAASNPALLARGKRAYTELKTFVADRPGHDLRYAIDPTKSHEQLGWRPRRSFEEGIRDTVRWYIEHADWCDAVQKNKYARERLGLGPGGGS